MKEKIENKIKDGSDNMFVIKRNQLIIVGLVIMIAIAGYFNYSDTKLENHDAVLQNEQSLKETTQPEYEVIDATEVANMNEDLPSEDEDIGTAIFVNNNLSKPIDDTFFLQAKMNREQIRAQRKEWLTEVINNMKIDNNKKLEATNELLEIQKRIEKENAAEALVESKGFREVYVRIDDNTVDVVVDVESLNKQQIAQIADIVHRKTNIEVSNIKINPLKKN